VRALYLTYNGLTEPLGRRQVMPYILGLAHRGWEYTVVSYEKEETADAAARAQVQAELAAGGVRWIPRRYHKRPVLPATAFDTADGIASGLLRGGRVDLVHARSTVPAMMAAAVAGGRRVPWIFDVRGLLAEEYVDGGHWPANGALFRLTAGSEARLMRGADGLVFLTERIRDELVGRAFAPDTPTAVVPCAVDLDRFAPPPGARERLRAELGLGDRPVLAYSGSLGSWYRLREMLDFFEVAAAEIPRLAWLILTPNEGEARRLVEGHRLGPDIRVARARPEEVPAFLSVADAGLCFLGDHHSKAASSPTKYGEYLAAGLAVVTNPWTGDAGRLRGEHAWILVEAFTPDAYRAAAQDLARKRAEGERLRREARALAARRFALRDAIDAYDGLYRRVLARGRR